MTSDRELEREHEQTWNDVVAYQLRDKSTAWQFVASTHSLVMFWNQYIYREFIISLSLSHYSLTSIEIFNDWMEPAGRSFPAFETERWQSKRSEMNHAGSFVMGRLVGASSWTINFHSGWGFKLQNFLSTHIPHNFNRYHCICDTFLFTPRIHSTGLRAHRYKGIHLNPKQPYCPSAVYRPQRCDLRPQNCQSAAKYVF